MNEVRTLSPSEFEHFSKFLLEAMGYSDVVVSPKLGRYQSDGGIDLFAKKDNTVFAVQCKHSRKASVKNVSPRPVRELSGAMGEKIKEGIFISTGGYSSNTKIYAMTNRIKLIGRDEIVAEMKKMNPDFEAEMPHSKFVLHEIKKELRQAWHKEVVPYLMRVGLGFAGLFLLGYIVIPYIFIPLFKLLPRVLPH